MKIEIMAIGDEVLKGFIVNQHATFIAQHLMALGLEAQSHRCIGDEINNLTKVITHSFVENDLLILTGGLGPTLDDNTRRALATLFDCELKYNASACEHLKNTFGEKIPSLANQSTQPSSARLLLNSVGTAPGLIFEKHSKVCIALPGVPNELHHLFIEQVLPYLKNKYKKDYYAQQVYFFNLFESTLDITLRKLKQDHPSIIFGIYASKGSLSVHISSDASHDINQAKLIVQQVKHELLNIHPKHVLPLAAQNMEEAIALLLKKQQRTLGVIETFTGGDISSRLNSTPCVKNFLHCSLIDQNLVKLTPAKIPTLVKKLGLPDITVVVLSHPEKINDNIYKAEVSVYIFLKDKLMHEFTDQFSGAYIRVVQRMTNITLKETLSFLLKN